MKILQVMDYSKAQGWRCRSQHEARDKPANIDLSPSNSTHTKVHQTDLTSILSSYLGGRQIRSGLCMAVRPLYGDPNHDTLLQL